MHKYLNLTLQNFVIYIPVILISLIAIIPLITIIQNSIGIEIDLEYLDFLNKLSITTYVKNSSIILFSVLIFTLTFGVISAYLVTFFIFPLSSFFKYALIMSFAIPPYIYAYSLSSFFENYGTGFSLLSLFISEDISNRIIPNLNPYFGTIISLSFCLFGYVYMLTRISFLNQSENLLEVAKSLGLSGRKRFFKILLPTARPAIIVGSSLVAMETLSDFGTVSFFGIPTLVIGIYNSWFIFDDLSSANILSLFLFVLILLFFYLENISSKNSRYHSIDKALHQKKIKSKLVGKKAFYAFIFCFLIFFFSFLFPLLQMMFWVIRFPEHFTSLDIKQLNINTFIIISVSSFVIITSSFYANFGLRVLKKKILLILSTLSISGYAIPGIIISISTISFFTMISNFLNINIKSLFIGSLYGLVLGYLFRFYSISFNTIKTGYSKINQSIDESAYLLGFSKFKTFKEIHLPFFKNNIFFIYILISLEIIKELPITLILRPYNFDTFSTKAYNFASQDLIEAAAAPSICLILWTTILLMMSIKFFLSDKK